MENASKALVIAGAILLVIAIIAIAVGIVSKTRGTMDIAGNQIDSMAIQMHNKQFEHYDGKGKTYEEVRNMLADITAYNAEVKNDNFKVKINMHQYNDSSNTNISSSVPCHSSFPEAIYRGICWYFRESTIDYLYDVSFEYNASGAIQFIKVVKYYSV